MNLKKNHLVIRLQLLLQKPRRRCPISFMLEQQDVGKQKNSFTRWMGAEGLYDPSGRLLRRLKNSVGHADR